MFEFLMFVAVVVLFAMLANTRGRLKRAEAILEESAKRIGALQRQAGLLPPKPGESFAPPAFPTAAAPSVDEPSAAASAERWRPKDTPSPWATANVADPKEPQDEPLRAAALASPPAPAIVEREIVEEAPVERLAAEPPVIAEEPSAPVSPHVEVTPIDPALAEPIEGTLPKIEEAAPPSPPPPPPPSPPSPATSPVPTPSLASRFENLFGKTLPIWAGGITLAIAGVLIVRYAIDAGFFARIFTRGVQVIAGGLFGAGLIGAAEFAWRNEDRVRDTRVPQALSGAGIATLYAAILVASNAYQLIAPLTAFILLAAVTAGALGLSLRFGAPSALLGLAGGLAAPALVGSVVPNVPLLAVYLGLTITGLTGVSRMRRWPWLALAALVGGAGWSLWMVVAGTALDTLGTLSVGGFVLLLAIALPLLAFDGPRAWLLRSASAVVGALQLALLVALGGFAPLDWGLFALLAIAGQWLTWRDKDYAIVPTISVVLSVLLLAIWPKPELYWFTLIGLSLAAIHALPLLVRLTSVQRALELCGIALAAPVLTKWQFPALPDATLALVAAGGALLAGAGVARLWRIENRDGDARLAWLASVAAGLVALALSLVVAQWAIPLAIGAVAALLLVFGQIASDRRIEPVATGFVAAALASLFSTPLVIAEVMRLLLGTDPAVATETLARLGGMTALLGFFAARAGRTPLRVLALTLSGGFAYAALAQVVPGWSLPLSMAGVALTIFAIGRRRAVPSIEALGGSFAAAAVLLLAVTGPQPVAEWSRMMSSDTGVDHTAMLRWGGLAALLAIFAWRAATTELRLSAHLAAGVLGYGLLAQSVPGWTLPLALAAVTVAMIVAGERGRTTGVARLAVLFAVASVPLLVISADNAFGEWSRLWGSDAAVTSRSLIRWGGVAALALVFAVRAQGAAVQRAAQIAAALLGYGALAQVVPGAWLMLVPAIAAAATLLAVPRITTERIGYTTGTFVALVGAWALVPLIIWADAALRSLGGVPMMLDAPALAAREVALRLLVPAVLLGVSLWLRRDAVPPRILKAALAAASVFAGVALHALYRQGFAASFGSDFVATGLGQRLLWDAVLIGGGWLAARRGHDAVARPLVWAGTAHLFCYSLILHNPLWIAQGVGAVPVLNLIAPLFMLAWFAMHASVERLTTRGLVIDRFVQLVTMTLVAGFAWATLRQAFHGTLLVDPGVTSAENILRSVLILALAVGFLLWGIRTKRHDWRIASLVLMLGAVAKVFLFDASGLEGLLRIGSFVVLGFSLIGIGWLYSRQLKRDGEPLRPADPSKSSTAA